MNATAGLQYLRARPRLIKGIQLVLVILTLGFCIWAVRDQWSKAGPLLADASVDRHGRADVEPAEMVEEAPHPDPHPVFVPRPVGHIRQ